MGAFPRYKREYFIRKRKQRPFESLNISVLERNQTNRNIVLSKFLSLFPGINFQLMGKKIKLLTVIEHRKRKSLFLRKFYIGYFYRFILYSSVPGITGLVTPTYDTVILNFNGECRCTLIKQCTYISCRI